VKAAIDIVLLLCRYGLHT